MCINFYTFSFNISFFLSPTCVYLTRLGVEGYYSFDHTQSHTTGGRTPLDEGSACRRDLYLATNNTHNKQTFVPSAGFEPAIPAGDRLQTHVLDRSAAGIGCFNIYLLLFKTLFNLYL